MLSGIKKTFARVRFVIACHSPGEFEESDYSLGQGRKDAMKGSTSSPVRSLQSALICIFPRNTGLTGESRRKTRGYSLRPDWVVERDSKHAHLINPRDCRD